ncbi:J domain-containing protein [Halomarina litorea]|uniref:J domain-containing protein n=1 Tax=Halomarina litorea TaxID=2961595 RepID=UPI0020C2D132|nr:J domain-containing protein [Halomarina sp. BCD28]
MKGAWFLVVLSAVLAGLAVVLGAAGLGGHGPALPVAFACALASYALWRVGRDRMIAHIYADVGEATFEDDGEAADPEDWHREGFRYADVDPGGWDDWWEPSDVDPEASFFDDEFWREWERSREERARSDDRRGDGTRRGGDRATGTRTDGSGSAETVDRATAAACEVLGVDPDAGEGELRRAYRRRVKETHPDRGGSEAAFRRVKEAYDHLRE